MGQRSNDAAVKDAPITPNKGECALGTEQRPNDVPLMGAQILLSKEECARGMGQMLNTNDVTLKDVQILLRGEEYARDTVHTATPLLMNLQLSHRALDQSLIRLL